MPRVTFLKINSVASNHGHVFLSGDAEEHDGNVIGYYQSCLQCGGEWVLRATPDAFSDGAHQANDGTDAVECCGPDAKHGEDRDEDDPGECNCLLCSG